MENEILILQHTEGTTPGTVLPWLQKKGRIYRHLCMHKGEILPTPSEHQTLILCGGGVHVDQENQYPWLKSEKKFIEQSMKLGNKVVGLCLGGQLCAQILGGRVDQHDRGWEIGWWDVTLHQTSGLAGFETEKKIRVSQYHRDIFEVPRTAQVIASNDWWAAQAFLWNKQVLGFQFHPERDLMGNRSCAMERVLPSEGQIQSADQILKLGETHQPSSARWFESVLDGFFSQ